MNFFLYELLPTILNMSITGCIVIIAVLAIRLLLKKAPKIFSYAIWAVVLFRLLCPLTFESGIGLLPSSEPIPQNIVFEAEPQINTGFEIIDNSVNEILPPATPTASVNPIGIWIFIGRIIWSIGIFAFLLYSVIQYFLLKRKLIGAKPLRDNIYLADGISSPFVMGLFKPKIYLPSSLPKNEYNFIIAHEKCHIKRLDHITRGLSFIALALHWFNPLVWVAYIASAKDMEMSCDEAVMKNMDSDIRAEYSTSLLRLATGKKLIFATPLAFGEGDTKGRVKNVMSYKKPMIWVSAVCLVVVLVVLVGFMGNRVPALEEPPTIYAYYEYGVVEMNLGAYSWTNNGVTEESSSIHPTEMDYPNPISYNENSGFRNANIIFSLDNDPDGWNSDNIKWNDGFNITSMKRYVNGQEEVLDDFDSNFILVSLENNISYIYEFKIEFDNGNQAYYSVQIDNNVTVNEEVAIATELAQFEQISIGTTKNEVREQFGQPDTYGNWGYDEIYLLTDAQITISYDSDIETAGFVEDVNINTHARLSLDNIITLSSKGEDLTWSDFEKYPYIEGGSGTYTREYPINGLFVFRIGGGLTDDIPMYMTLYAKTGEETEHSIDIRYENVTDFVSKHDQEEPLLWDLPPMVMIEDRLYLDTGKLSEDTLFQNPEHSDFDGTITSTVNGNERPTQNNQSNFGEDFGYRVIDDESIALYINEEWYVFEIEEKAPLELFHDLSADGEVSLALGETGDYTFRTNSEKISISLESTEQIDATIMLFTVEDTENSIAQFDLRTGESDIFTNLTSATDYLIRVSAFEYFIRSDVDPHEKALTISD